MAVSPRAKYTHEELNPDEDTIFKSTSDLYGSKADADLKKQAVVFKIFYKRTNRETISFLLPNSWLISFTFYPPWEAKQAALQVPQVGGLANKEKGTQSLQAEKPPTGRTKQAQLQIADDTGPLKNSAKVVFDYSDDETVIGGYWLPNGVYVRRVETKQKDGAAPAYAEGEVRVVGCPLDEDGLAVVRFIAKERPWEGGLQKLLRKLLRQPPLPRMEQVYGPPEEK